MAYKVIILYLPICHLNLGGHLMNIPLLLFVIRHDSPIDGCHNMASATIIAKLAEINALPCA